MTAIATSALDSRVEGAINLRDLGGIRVQDGMIRTGRIYRSAMTHHITPAGLAVMAAGLGVRTVIDFRNQGELDTDGTSDFDSAAIRHINLPISANSALPPEERSQQLRSIMEGMTPWATLYAEVIRSCSDSYVGFFEALAREETYGAVFHCSGGRDRTGIAAALLLDVLGADDDAIAEDYHATGPNLHAHAHRFMRFGTEMGMSEAEMLRMLMTSTGAMHEFLTVLRHTYGGAEDYLVQNGLDPAALLETRGLLIDRS